MRILHTSDWHLGRSFHRADLLEAQARFLDHLVEVVRAEAVELVVVAGDVYDRALPPVDAVALLDDGLARLLDAGCRVVVSSGNHDSARRLGFGSRMLASAGLHVRTDPALVDVPVLVEDRHGPVAVYPVPYLEPAVEAERWRVERTHAAVLGEATRRIREDLTSGRGRVAGGRSVVTAHAFVVGGQVSDSERDISVGGVAAVPLSAFDGFSYTALGHLHGRQRLAETVRYSGSPIAYSFSEARHRKGSWLVELGPAGVVGVEEVAAPVERPLAVLRGDLAELLADPRLAGHEVAWCQVTLTDAERPAEPMRRLRERFPHTVEVRFEPRDGGGPELSYARQQAGRDDLGICCGFLDRVRGRAAAPEEVELFREALVRLRLRDAEAGRPERFTQPAPADLAELVGVAAAGEEPGELLDLAELPAPVRRTRPRTGGGRPPRGGPVDGGTDQLALPVRV